MQFGLKYAKLRISGVFVSLFGSLYLYLSSYPVFVLRFYAFRATPLFLTVTVHLLSSRGNIDTAFIYYGCQISRIRPYGLKLILIQVKQGQK